MADAEPDDLLSQLPDELLQHILHLAPCREAETTAVLSRRWRGLWPLTTRVVKIDMPSRGNWRRDVFIHRAEEAIAAATAQGPVQRLAVHKADDDDDCWFDEYIARHVLSHQACRGVQDVRIGEAAADTTGGGGNGDGDGDGDGSVSWLPNEDVGVFKFSLFGVMPSAALRVLHITNGRDLPWPPPSSSSTFAFFPRLEVLRLRRCHVSLDRLQDMVVASPQLAALQLEYVYLAMTPVSSLGPTDVVSDSYYRWYYPQSLCCPSITTLVLLNCCGENDRVAIELDVPRVQHFRYRGTATHFTLRSPLPDVRRPYLHFLTCYSSGLEEMRESFWNFLKSFKDAKVLKLKLEWPIDGAAFQERRRIGDLLDETSFNVEHLEINVPQGPAGSKDVGVAIGNLLQCCPGLQDLRIKLTTANDRQPWRRRRTRIRSTSLQQGKAQLGFHKSMDHFRRSRDSTAVPLCRDDGKVEVSDIPGLSDRWLHLNCLQFHLKRLSLQFDIDKDNPNCVGVRLVKFFVERGLALEEIYIDDGNMKLWEHMNCKISRYAANPQPFPEYHVLERMSQTLSMKNQFSSSKISGWCQPHKLQVRRTHPWSTSRRFTILPLAT